MSVFSDQRLKAALCSRIITAWQAPGMRVALFKLAIRSRYKTGKLTGRWELVGLRRLFMVISRLPGAHVNRFINTYLEGGFKGWASRRWIGKYLSRTTAFIGYDPRLADIKTSKKRDSLFGVNMFDSTLIHEIGHSVDSKLNVMKRFGSNAKFGKWKRYPDYMAAARDLSRDTNAVTTQMKMWRILGALMQRRRLNLWQAVLSVEGSYPLGDPMAPPLPPAPLCRTGRSSRRSRPRSGTAPTPRGTGSSSQQRQRRRLRISCRALYARYDAYLRNKAVKISQSASYRNRPWRWNDSKARSLSLRGYVYQEGYLSRWTRYALSARRYRISDYQFRDPGDFFAELYPAYFMGRMQAAHPLKNWFSRYVHRNPHMNPRKLRAP